MSRSHQLTERERMNLTARAMKYLGKHAYASERIANLRAEQLTEKRAVQLWAYRCALCKAWHHTSKRPREAAPRSKPPG